MSFKDYFQVAAGDPSRVMLDLLTGDAGPISEILYVLNIAVFSVAVVVLIYTVFSGLVRTAQTGEFLGEKKSWLATLKIPLGLGGLVPVFGGLGLAQIVVIFCGIIGVGIGNLAWEAGYESLLALLPSSPFSAPAPATQLPAARALLAALVCEEKVNRSQVQDAAYLGTDPGPLVIPQFIDSRTLWRDFDGIALIYGGVPGYPDDVCGGVRVPLSETDSEHFDKRAVEVAHSKAMGEMAAALRPMALAIVDSGSAPSADALDKAAGAYEQSVAAALAGAVVDTNSSFASWMDNDGGSWIYAGSMLSKIASISREIQAAAGIKAEAVPNAEAQQETNVGVLAVAESARLITAGAEERSKTAFSLKNPDLGVLVEPLRSELVEKVLGALALEDQDLLGGLGNLGHIITAGAVAAAGSVLGGLSLISGGSLGTLGGLAGSAFSVFVYIFCVPLFGAGLMFSYFLPFLPLIYWVSGVLGWLLLFVQALFLSPLWMLAHIAGGTDDMGRAENGYLKMLDLMLRPALMVAGLVAGWVILLFFGGFLKLSLSVFFGGGSTFTGAAGILGFVATIMLFAYLAWQVVTRAFSLIHQIPDLALSWIGGIGGDDKEIENKVVGAVGNIGRSGRGINPGGGGGGGATPPPGVPPGGVGRGGGAGGGGALPPPK